MESTTSQLWGSMSTNNYNVTILKTTPGNDPAETCTCTGSANLKANWSLILTHFYKAWPWIHWRLRAAAEKDIESQILTDSLVRHSFMHTMLRNILGYHSSTLASSGPLTVPAFIHLLFVSSWLTVRNCSKCILGVDLVHLHLNMMVYRCQNTTKV